MGNNVDSQDNSTDEESDDIRNTLVEDAAQQKEQ